MQRSLAGGLAFAAVLAGVLSLGGRPAEASRPFKPVTRLRCEACHTSKDEAKMTDQDLNDCGKKAYALLKQKGYMKAPLGKEDVTYQRAKARVALTGFKCD